MDHNNPIIAGRKNLNLKQTELAKMLGVTKQSVNSWEKGKTKPKYMHIIKLAKLFGVSIECLLDKVS